MRLRVQNIMDSRLCEMNMTVDVVGTEAVIAHALGAETEFQFGMLRVRPAADGALMQIMQV